MSARSDPLLAINQALDRLSYAGSIRDHIRLQEARAAVLELASTAREVVKADRAGELTDVLIDRLDAALAPFGDKP